MSRISKYISLAEATKSQTATRYGIDNNPISELHLSAMKNVATEIFDKVREHFGVPIGVSSFYRSPALNKKIRGSRSSQHCIGEAIDIDADMFGKITNKQIFDYIRANFEFDQLINEFPTGDEPAWVHVSLKLSGLNRGQVLQADRSKNGKTTYKLI